jgi:hypothetical protein
MPFFPAFYYARSFSAFERPGRIVYYNPPCYTSGSPSPACYTSSPFILNYLKNRYRFGQLTAGPGISPTLGLFVAEYKRYPKPVRHFALPALLRDGTPIAHYYHPDNRMTVYQQIFFQRFLLCFFRHRLFQLSLISRLSVIKSRSHLALPTW